MAFAIACTVAPATADEGGNAKLTLEGRAAASSPWHRIVTVGASATAGVRNSGSTDGTNIAAYRLSQYLGAALLVPHEPVRNYGNTFFFLAPTAMGKAQIDRTLKAEPSLVVAVDFLFWFCYGDVPEGERLRRFEKGLELLAPIRCPLIVGDIPDASAATNGMLHPNQVPTRTTIAAANDRLLKWAGTRKETAVIALSTFMEAATHNEPIRIRNLRWPESRILLQEDRLHPTARGAALLALAVADRIVSHEQWASEKQIRWDFETVFRNGFETAANRPAEPGVKVESR